VRLHSLTLSRLPATRVTIRDVERSDSGSPSGRLVQMQEESGAAVLLVLQEDIREQFQPVAEERPVESRDIRMIDLDKVRTIVPVR
jgi:hypothetical protein